MGRFLLYLSSLLLLTSCGGEYNIAGSSSVPYLDGRMLYLRTSLEDSGGRHSVQSATICLDSCKVIHGRFNFTGDVDSVQMAMLFMGSECVMPLVIERGDLNIRVDNMAQNVSGSPLNEKLYAFFKRRNRLDNEMWELQQKSIRMMREGRSPEEINNKVGKKMQRLYEDTEELEVKFVRENYDNVLGPGFFMLLCSQYPTPILTPQISEIIDDAPACFLNNPYVSGYLRQANARAVMPLIEASDE